MPDVGTGAVEDVLAGIARLSEHVQADTDAIAGQVHTGGDRLAAVADALAARDFDARSVTLVEQAASQLTATAAELAAGLGRVTAALADADRHIRAHYEPILATAVGSRPDPALAATAPGPAGRAASGTARARIVDDHTFTDEGWGTFRLQLFTAPGHRPVAVAIQADEEGLTLTNGAEYARDRPERGKRSRVEEALPKYEIPEYLLEEIARYPGIVLHRGCYVDTNIKGVTGPDDAFCAFCDGTRRVRCQTCNGEGVLVADTPTPVYNEDDDEYYDEYEETACPAKRKDGMITCPQWRARWCHES